MTTGVLSQGGIEQIQDATATLLETVGARVMSDSIRRAAEDRGAIVDSERGIIRFPRQLLAELLALCPPRYTVRGMDGFEATIGGDKATVTAIVTDPWITDYETGNPRRPTIKDVTVNTILAQLNPRVASISRMDFPVTDHPGPESSRHALEAHLLNHAKHYAVYATDMESIEEWLEIGRIVLGGRDLHGSDLMSFAVAVVSPLVISEMNCRILLAATKHRFPVIPTVCPMSGTTAPYDKVGTLLIANAECLLVAALTQILAPGTPFLYAVGPSVSDMRTGDDLYYTVDKALWKIGAAELSRSYGLPCMSECGGTLVPQHDVQSGAESMLFMLAARLSGADVLSGLGSCNNAMGLTSEMTAIQREWLGVADYLAAGLPLDSIDECLESIRRQGPGGTFLADDLTIRNLRSDEFYRGELMARPGDPDALGAMLERAHRSVEEAVRGFVSPVPEGIAEEIIRHFCARRKALGEIV